MINKKLLLSGDDLEKQKKRIDEDFELFKDFKDNPRFIQLEKSWIKNLSHSIMPTKNGFIHEDRKSLRDNLLKYLNSKVTRKSEIRPIWTAKKLREYKKLKMKN
jgi:hypothetical protein